MLKNSTSTTDARINRLIGQIEGVRRMIHRGRDADEVVQQIMAAREALSRLGVLVLHHAVEKLPKNHTKKAGELMKRAFRI